MGDHALLVYPPHGQRATGDVDYVEAFAFYEINLHLRFEANQKHYGYQIYVQISLNA